MEALFESGPVPPELPAETPDDEDEFAQYCMWAQVWYPEAREPWQVASATISHGKKVTA